MSTSTIDKATSSCRSCAVINVSHKNPCKKKRARPRKRAYTPSRELLPDSSPLDSSPSPPSTDDEPDLSIGSRPPAGFNHRLVQDCIAMPPSITHGNQTCSVIIDHHSSFTTVKPIKTPSCAGTSQHLLSWFDALGCPFAVQTDNGPEFSHEFTSVCAKHGVLHRKGIVARPQQQGKVERVNRSLKKLTSLFVRHRQLQESSWEWGMCAAVYAHNHVPTTTTMLPPVHFVSSRPPSGRHWPGDRVAFKPRGTSLQADDPSSIRKILVGEFCGFLNNGQALVYFVTNSTYEGVLVDKRELVFLPLSISDCVSTSRQGFSEPWNIDLATRLAMDPRDPESKVHFDDLFNDCQQSDFASAFKAAASATAGKTHLEVTKAELDSGTHDIAIVKEFESFMSNGVLGPCFSSELEARNRGYEIVSFRGVASWKLKDGARVAKWRGVCRGFQDKWEGDVDTDAPSQTMVKLCFLVGYSRKLTAMLSDARTAFLQVPCPVDRRVAVRIRLDRFPPGLPSLIRPGGVYPLQRMLYGLKDSPRRWVLHLKGKLERLNWFHIGSAVFTRGTSILIAY